MELRLEKSSRRRNRRGKERGRDGDEKREDRDLLDILTLGTSSTLINFMMSGIILTSEIFEYRSETVQNQPRSVYRRMFRLCRWPLGIVTSTPRGCTIKRNMGKPSSTSSANIPRIQTTTIHTKWCCATYIVIGITKANRYIYPLRPCITHHYEYFSYCFFQILLSSSAGSQFLHRSVWLCKKRQNEFASDSNSLCLYLRLITYRRDLFNYSINFLIFYFTLSETQNYIEIRVSHKFSKKPKTSKAYEHKEELTSANFSVPIKTRLDNNQSDGVFKI